jgi:hypothetical protein
MGNELQEALNGIQQLSRLAAGVLKLAAVLQKVQSIENAERDALNRRDVALKAASEVEAKAALERDALSGLQMQIVSEGVKLKEAQAAASAAGAGIIQAAHAKAAEIVANAEVESGRVREATRAAMAKLAEIEKAIAAKEATIKELEIKFAGLKEKALASFR